jgi:hypothetical protein
MAQNQWAGHGGIARNWLKITGIGGFEPPGEREDSRSDGNVLTQDKDYRAHPLATTDAVTIEMERDEATKSFVTFVKELQGMSTFGDTEFDALEMTG